MTGTPAAMQPGVVVRVRVGGAGYASRGLTLDEAQELADRMETDLAANPDGYITFPAHDCAQLRLRAAKVMAVEIRPRTGMSPFATGGIIQTCSGQVTQ